MIFLYDLNIFVNQIICIFSTFLDFRSDYNDHKLIKWVFKWVINLLSFTRLLDRKKY